MTIFNTKEQAPKNLINTCWIVYIHGIDCYDLSRDDDIGINRDIKKYCNVEADSAMAALKICAKNYILKYPRKTVDWGSCDVIICNEDIEVCY